MISEASIKKAIETLAGAAHLRAHVDIMYDQVKRHPGDSLREYTTDRLGMGLGREMTKVMQTRLAFEPSLNRMDFDNRYSGEVFVLNREQFDQLTRFVEYVQRHEDDTDVQV